MNGSMRDTMGALECDIYRDNSHWYILVRRGDGVPDDLRRDLYKSETGDFLYRPVHWQFVISQTIYQGVPTQEPIEGWLYEGIIEDLNRVGYATDYRRVVSEFDTVVLEFEDDPGKEIVVTVVGKFRFDSPRYAPLIPHIAEGQIVSPDTAVGRAIQGAKLSDVVEIETPTKTRYAHIKTIKKRPDDFFSIALSNR